MSSSAHKQPENDESSGDRGLPYGDMNPDVFYQLAMRQGQRRLGAETFEMFYRRVLKTKKQRDNRPEAWRPNQEVGK